MFSNWFAVYATLLSTVYRCDFVVLLRSVDFQLCHLFLDTCFIIDASWIALLISFRELYIRYILVDTYKGLALLR